MQYVLYVGRDKHRPADFCPGSLVCLSIVEKIQQSDIDVQVQDCTILKQSQQLPDWLNGTPILVCRGEDLDPQRGRAAVDALLELRRRQESGAALGRQKAPSSSRPPPARIEAVQTRQHAAQADLPPEPPMGFADDNVFEDEEEMVGGSSSVNAQIRSDKVTEEDLQKYMQQRNLSAASAVPPEQQGGVR